MDVQTKILSVQIILSLSLILVTLIYVFYTGSMANTMKKQFDQNNRPFLFLDKFEIVNYDSGGIEFRPHLKNSGPIPAKYEMKEIRVESGNFSYVIPLRNQNGFVFPNEESRFLFASLNSEIFNKFDDKFKLMISLKYKSIYGENYSYFYEQHYGFDKNNLDRFETEFINSN